MGRKRMDDEEKVRIFARRQENVTTKKSADILRGQGHLLAAARDMPQDAIPATKS